MSVTFPELRVGDPIRHEALSVFPLFAESNGGAPVDYLLADEALAAKSLAIEEVSEAGSVPNLQVVNKGDASVLFIEGEELVGAKQNRILNTTVLVAAHSEIKIPVSCVEQGRWGYKSRQFGSSGSHSPSKLRRALKGSVSHSLKENRGHQSNQGQVWEEVACLQSAFGVKSGTSAMSDAFASYEDRIAQFREKLKYVKGATGMAVAIGDKVVAVDLFDKPSTCQKVWDRLLSGVVFDALEDGRDDIEVPAEGVEQLISTTTDAAWQETDAVGEGTEYRADFAKDHASALTYESTLVHASVVAGA